LLIDGNRPVIYRHFKGDAAIVAAVATGKFEVLAKQSSTKSGNASATDVLRNVRANYLVFFRSRPTTHEAMLALPTKTNVASKETQRAPRAAIAELSAELWPGRQAAAALAEVTSAHCMNPSSLSNRNVSRWKVTRTD
jgi:hypothetical protein